MKEQLIREVQRQMLPYLNNAQLKPVSYTHLDVYKRQVLVLRIMSLAMRPNEVNTEVQYDCKVRHQAVISVSYTHLDVYKRQTICRTRSICWNTMIPSTARTRRKSSNCGHS